MKSKIFIVLLLVLGFVPSGSQAQNTTENIAKFDVAISIEASGNILVKESISYDFGSNQRRGIFRNIPVKYDARGGNYNLRLENINVTDDTGKPLTFTTTRDGDDLSIKIGDADIYLTGLHTYVISYETDRALNFFDDHDELYWNAIGDEWGVTILSASSSVTTPVPSDQVKATCFTGTTGSTDKNCEISQNGNTVTYTAGQLQPNNGLTIVAGLPKGVIHELTTSEKILRAIQDNWILGLPLIVFLLMFRLWKRYGKNPKGKTTITAQYEAPHNLTPLEVGTLVDYSANNQDLSAEIIYLATKGYIHINRIETTKLLVLKGHDYELKKLKDAGPELNEVDKMLLEGLFESSNDIKLSELAKNISFGKELQKIKKKVAESLVKDKYFPRNPWTIAIICVIIGIILGIWGSIFMAAIFGFYGGLASAISGLIIAGFGFLMPNRTVKGVEARALILGLKEYMNVAEKDRMKFHNAPEKNPQLFEKLLPFAIALKVDKAWAKQFEEIYKSNPSWYSDSSGHAFNAYFLSSSLGDFSSSLNSAVASTTTSASSGGSGFSGGGGGGFGGGGGGSW